MRLGFTLPQMGPLAGPHSLALVARRAEELGFDGLWVAERSLYPLEPTAPYPGGDVLPEAFKTTLDPLDALTFVAGQTTRVGLGTSIINLPWYSPVLLARRLTTLDVLSNGRLRVGLGLGWSPDEYQAAGIPWQRRLARGKEALQVLKTIWTTDPVEFDGEFYRVPRSHIGPKPVQKPHPPLYIGAFAPPALAWAATDADGWIGGGAPAAAVAQMFAGISATAQQAGRDPDTLELIVGANVNLTGPLGEDRPAFAGAPEQIAADIAAARDAGAAELVLNVLVDPGVGSLDDLGARLELLHRLSGHG